jgi:hypothetical protein
MASGLVGLDDLYRGDATRRERFREFARKQLAPQLARLGWEEKPGDDAPARVLRLRLIDALGRLEDPQVMAQALRLFEAQAKDPASLPASLRRNVLEVVARNADAAAWERLHAMALAEQNSLLHEELYLMLAMSRNDSLAQRALEMALSDEPGASIGASMIQEVAVEHPALAFDFAVAHRDEVDRRIDTYSRTQFYVRLANTSLDPAMPARLEAFAARYLAAGSRGEAEAVIANIRYRVQVRDKRLPAIDDWLRARSGASS